jgi:hypothetical protein
VCVNSALFQQLDLTEAFQKQITETGIDQVIEAVRDFRAFSDIDKDSISALPTDRFTSGKEFVSIHLAGDRTDRNMSLERVSKRTFTSSVRNLIQAVQCLA